MQVQSAAVEVVSHDNGPSMTDLLPRELLIQVASHVGSQADLQQLLRCSRVLHSLRSDIEMQLAWMLNGNGGPPTALHHTINMSTPAKQRVALLQRLIASPGVDVNAPVAGLRPLEAAAGNGLAQTVQALLDTPGIDPNAVNSRGYSALWHACEGLHLAVVEVLLHHPGIHVNKKQMGNWSALHLMSLVDATQPARAASVAAITALLLAHPAIEVNAAGYIGYTPLHLACLCGSVAVTKLLVRHPGVNLQAVNSDGWTAQKIVEINQRRGTSTQQNAEIAQLLNEATA